MNAPLELAYLGDSVYETAVRAKLVREHSLTSKEYNARAFALVNAPAQAKGVKLIEPLLSEEEANVLRKGRNAKGGNVPKKATVAEYRTATGLETLVGWLYWTGADDRLGELMNIALKEGEEHGV